ncbi:MAG: type II toxin-antitoxin system prevent-host-death family antitoxin [Desulfobacterales bacterium]|nr:type II toxin-antitoxin system prevent-host-death family antitoxin [Desulfobacterales bacterium]
MKIATVGELKNNLNNILSAVEHGESVRILRRDVPIARLVPCKFEEKRNKTVLGCGQGTVKIETDLTEPMIPETSWDMLKK